jgi:hypothetical protein
MMKINYKKLARFAAIAGATFCINNNSFGQTSKSFYVLHPEIMKADVHYYNDLDKPEDVINYVPDAGAYNWMADNIPLFECPDTTLQNIYYYRWWCFRKHLVKTPVGFVFTEFITLVKFAGPYNTISSALGHQINEGRWLRNSTYINQYISYWLFYDKYLKKQHFHSFSTWVEDAVYHLFLVNQDTAFLRKIVPPLDSDYHRWEGERQLKNKMFWQYDVKDAMEESISGGRHVKNMRPTINSYMYGNAKALAKMGAVLGDANLVKKYQMKTDTLRMLVQKNLWDDSASFFEVKHPDGKFANAREELGFIPWYFNLPNDENKYAQAWDQLIDTTGFDAPWGITTAERRNPLFRTHGSGHGCEWDGAVWPYATTQTLKGLANLLDNYKHKGKMNASVFYYNLHKYAWAQQKDGHPFIGEYQDEKTGAWLRNDPRSRFYNHSSFADLIINDLIGLRPREDNKLEISPLIPKNKWDWFCLDGVKYHHVILTILWDKNGKKYKKGRGFRIFENGREIFHSKKLKKVEVNLL